MAGFGSSARATRAFRGTLPGWNRGRTDGAEGSSGFYLVADDIVGGFFAMNGGGLDGAKNEIFYHSPDSLAWEPMKLSYTAFLNWALMGDLHSYYAPFRWLDWESDALSIAGDRAISFHPILSMPGPRLDRRRRGSIPVAEMYSLHVGSAPLNCIRPQSRENVRGPANVLERENAGTKILSARSVSSSLHRG